MKRPPLFHSPSFLPWVNHPLGKGTRRNRGRHGICSFRRKLTVDTLYRAESPRDKHFHSQTKPLGDILFHSGRWRLKRPGGFTILPFADWLLVARPKGHGADALVKSGASQSNELSQLSVQMAPASASAWESSCLFLWLPTFTPSSLPSWKPTAVNLKTVMEEQQSSRGWGTICPTPPHPGAVLRPVRLHGSSGQSTFSWCGQETTSFALRWSSESTHKCESPSSIPSTQPGLHRRLWALWSLPSGTTLGFVSVVKAFLHSSELFLRSRDSVH